MNIRKLRNNFGKVSFSQSGEDLIINYICQVRDLKNPSYLDVGAHHPWQGNNTAIFYLQGNRGINIEPDPDLFSLFTKHRKGDINLNVGIGAQSGSLDFYIMAARTLNTFSKEEAEKYEKDHGYRIKKVIKVPVITLSDVLSEYHNQKNPDIINIDAEGLDFEILKTIDFQDNPPKIICIETRSFSEKGMGKLNTDIIDYLEGRDFLHYANTNINSIFVLKSLWVI